LSPLKRSRPVRIRIRFRVEIRDSRRQFDAEARDVSIDGLCLSSPILMTIGDRAGTSLHVPGRPLIPLSFEVRWARVEGPKSYLLGVEFVHTSETRKALQKLMWQIESGEIKGIDSRSAS
jgi:hypothetical protein